MLLAGGDGRVPLFMKETYSQSLGIIEITALYILFITDT